ncbi:hypothetical protein ACHAWF_003649 [Thalassiosira exigua]
MDDWTDEQYGRMARGGNAKWRDHLVESGGGGWDGGDDEGGRGGERGPRLREKVLAEYESSAARVYREALSFASKNRARRSYGSLAVSLSESFEPEAPMPAMRAVVEGVLSSLPQEPAPSFRDVLRLQAWPFAVSMLRSWRAKLMILAWGLLGASFAYSVHFREANHPGGKGKKNDGGRERMDGEVSVSLPSGANACSAFSLGILAVTAGIPYLMLCRVARKVARGLLDNRQDAFKSARNLLAERVAAGRAQRLRRCDVYYPPISRDEELRAKCGLIFFPGTLVDRAAYAPIMSRLSEYGILVCVANLEPYRVLVSLDNYPLRENVMHMLSDSVLLCTAGAWTVDEWAIGGHSMGGWAAITAVTNELSSTIRKVVLWGLLSYPDPGLYPWKRTLREVGTVDALVVNGSNDGIIGQLSSTKDEAHTSFRKRMPKNGNVNARRNRQEGLTSYITIDGGNHAGCAHYGPQNYPRPDGTRTITLEQQQRQTVEGTVDFLLGDGKED